MAKEIMKRALMRAAAPGLLAMMGAIAIAPTSASAQQSSATAPASAAQSDETTTSEEIVVTGERRSVQQFEATSAVTVLSNEELAARGVVNLDTLQMQAPGLTVSNAGVANLVNIRGVGRTEVQATDAAGVQIYRDGVATFNGYFSGSEPYFDIGSVEVYKGPQGTFAGQNSTGGAIFVRSIDPDFHGVSGYAQVQAGSDQDRGFLGAINVPITNTLGVRLAAVGEERDSVYNYSGPFQGHPGELTLGAARLTVLWEPSENFTVRLKADGDYVDQGASSYSPVLATTNLYDITSNAPLRDVNRFYRLSADLAYTFHNGAVLRSLSGYQAGRTINFSDSDGSDVGSNTLQYKANEDIISQEVNLVSPSSDRFRYILGVFYTRDNLQIPSFFAAQPPILASLVDNYRISTNYAAFASFNYDITPSLHAEIGGRFNRGQQKQDVVTDVFFGPFPLAHVVGPSELPDADDSTTGKISLSYDINDQNFVYAFVARGHKNAGLNTDTTVPTFDGENLTDYEFGYRRRFLDNQLVFQLAGYFYQYEDYQFIRLDPVSRVTAQENVPGQSQVHGIEAQLDGHMGDTAFNLSATWADSKLPTFFADDPRNPSATPCLPGGPSTSPQCLNLSGRGLPYIPEWTFTAGVEHSFATPLGSLTPRVDVAYVANQTTTLWQGPGDELGARTIVNAQLQLVNANWTATAYVTNALNEEYVVAVSSGLRAPGVPRQVGVRLMRRF